MNKKDFLPIAFIFTGFVAYAQGISICFAKLFPSTFTYNYAWYLFATAIIFIGSGFTLRYYYNKKRMEQ